MCEPIASYVVTSLHGSNAARLRSQITQQISLAGEINESKLSHQGRPSRYAIAAAASSTALLVFAQDAATPAQAMEEVTVVGTRIVRKDYEANQPASSRSGEDTFKLSGEPQIETVLNAVAAAGSRRSPPRL